MLDFSKSYLNTTDGNLGFSKQSISLKDNIQELFETLWSIRAGTNHIFETFEETEERLDQQN